MVLGSNRPLAPLASLLVIGLSPACTEHGVPSAFTPDHLLECEAMEPCGLVSDFPQGPGIDAPTAYETGQTCALENLALGGPFLLNYNYGCEGICYGESFLLRADGTVLRQSHSETFDEGAPEAGGIKVEFEAWEDAEQCLLKDVSYFQDCLDNFDTSCAHPSNWATDCNPPAVVTCGD